MTSVGNKQTSLPRCRNFCHAPWTVILAMEGKHRRLDRILIPTCHRSPCSIFLECWRFLSRQLASLFRAMFVLLYNICLPFQSGKRDGDLLMKPSPRTR